MSNTFNLGREATLQLHEVVNQVLYDQPIDETSRTLRAFDQDFLLGKTTAAHTGCTTQDVDLYFASTKNEETNSGITVSAYNRFGGDLANGAWVLLGPIQNGYEILVGNLCPRSADTPWSEEGTGILFIQSGQFTSTVKQSENVSGVDSFPAAISWDGTNTPWCGNQANKLYLQSAQFTSTLKTSEDVSGVDDDVVGISWDGTNTPWCGAQASKLYLQSAQFTSTLKTSEDVSGVDILLSGISWDGTNTPWCDKGTDKLRLQSAQFTSTLKTSKDVSSIIVTGNLQDISWDGVDTPWIADGSDKLYLQSAQFTSTLKTSESINLLSNSPTGINTNHLTIG